jgi:hypothetical protein
MLPVCYINRKKFINYLQHLNESRVYKFKNWYWKPLLKSEWQSDGYCHTYFLFFRKREDGKFLKYEYYYRGVHNDELSLHEMAESVLNAAIVCGYWKEM